MRPWRVHVDASPRGSSPLRSTHRRAVGAATLAEAFRLTVEDFPDRVAVRTLNDEVSLTSSALRDRVDALAGGLARSASRAATPSR